MTNEKCILKYCECVVRTTGYYYKMILIWGGIMVLSVGILVGIFIAGSTYLPTILTQLCSGLASVPIWVYIPVGLITLPVITAVVVCWANRNEEEIKKADAPYTCKEEE